MLKVSHEEVVFDSSVLIWYGLTEKGSERFSFAVRHNHTQFITHVVLSAQIVIEVRRRLGDKLGYTVLAQMAKWTDGSFDDFTSSPEYMVSMRERDRAAFHLPYGSLGDYDEAIIDTALRNDAILVTNDDKMAERAKHRGVKRVYTGLQYIAATQPQAA